MVAGLQITGFPLSRAPKNGDGNPNLGTGIPPGHPEIVGRWDTFKLEVSDRKLRNCQGNPNSGAGFSKGNSNFN